jgi:hypothetical protein
MRKFAYLLILVIQGMGCTKPYNPPVIAFAGSYLVVAGVINAGSDSTTITLSKTVKVSTASAAVPVPGATVSVVSDQGVVYPLTASGNGNYFSAGLNLDITHQYRLSIKTPNNEQYQSDLVPVNITPPIDSIGFNIVSAPALGIEIYANTHDAANAVKYYRWDYTENWEFYSKYISFYLSNGSSLVERTASQVVDHCYTGDASSDIVLGSSAKLQQNVLYQSPIAFIPSTSEKTEDEYSILLREYALTADAYNFWLSQKTNSEELGSIFDAQPTQITGNIHCISNPSEPVIGYISVCTVTSKRIFITKQQLPNWVTTYPYSCEKDSIAGSGVDLITDTTDFDDAGPLATPFTPGPLLYTSVQCADCTIRGSRTPPPFWP